MKKFLLYFAILLIAQVVFSQTPSGFSYQAVLRDAEGKVLINQTLSLRVSLTNSDGSTSYYSEVHSASSNDFGIINIIIGNGQDIIGSMVNIPWSSQSIFINLEIKPSGSNTYTQLGRQQLQSVPYALYAADGLSIQWLGSLSAGPTSPSKNQAYYNSIEGTSYIWDGDSWEILAQDGLVGPQGLQGVQGEIGPQGIQGVQGDAGISISWLGSFDVAPTPTNLNQAYYNSTDKVSYIWDGNSWEILVKDGVAGPKGDTGNTGPQGEIGPTGVNGISLLWLGSYAVAPAPSGSNQAYYNSTDKKAYVWDGDSWEILAQDGAQGPQGIQGEQGVPGLQGVQGETGPQGPQGIQGEVGPQGSAGPQGVAGPQGPQGPTGVGLTLRGDWSADSTYVEGDYVFDESTSNPLVNSMWICQALIGPVAIQPKNDADHWVEFEAPEGPQGPQGLQGIQGPTGAQGPAGSNGISLTWLGSRATAPETPSINNAYYNSTDKKAYVWNGTVWSTIAQDGAIGPIGPTGPQGLKGDTGNTGPVGPTGASGISLLWLGSRTSAPSTPSLNQAYYNSTLLKSYVWDGDSWEIISQDGATGPKGDKGDKGDTGATGANGISINWLGDKPAAPPTPSLNQAYYNTTLFKSFVWDGDSWEILAQDGPQGIQGESGPAGPQGPTGANGISLVWKGTLASAPSSPLTNWAYYNSVNKKSYVWDGDSWEILAQDGVQGETGPLVSGTNGQMLVHNGTTWTATSAITLKSDTLGFGLNSPISRLIVKGESTALPEDPIFEVKNKDGKVVLGVYNEGVRVYVAEGGTKGAKGGFAVGGLSTQGKGDVEYLRITPDSARIYIDTSATKGAKGGFAVGGISTQGKVIPYEIFRVTKDSTRVYVTDNATKGAKGGFAVGGISTQGKQLSYDLLRVTKDSTRIYVDELTKGAKGGFAVGGISTQGKASSSQFLNITPENYFIGHEAGDSILTGRYNSFMGYQAGKSTKGGSKNIFMGYQSGMFTKSGNENIFIGYQAGNLNNSGNWNTFLGTEAGFSNSGSDNTFIGYKAGRMHQNEGGNVYIGSKAGQEATHGMQNVYIGEKTGYSTTYGRKNVFIGYESGFYTTGSVSDTSKGSFNVYLGYMAGKMATTNTRNVFIGYQAGMKTITGTDPVEGNYNVYLGSEAGLNNETGYANTAIGEQALKANTTGRANVAIGRRPLISNTTGIFNIAVGNTALYYNESGKGNVAIGSGALGASLIADHNVAVGEGALIQVMDSANVAIGPWTLANLRFGINNTAIGKKANVAVFGGTYYNTTAIGYEATVTESNQVVIGNDIVNNVVIKGIKNATTTEKPNVYINDSGQLMKSSASLVAGTGSSSKVAFWNGTGTITSNTNLHWDNTNGFLGIGETTPASRLHINQSTGSLPVRITKATSSNYWGFGVRVVGTDNDDFVFAFNGSVMGFIDNADGSWDQASDKNLKTNIEPIGHILNKVLLLKPSSFNFISDTHKKKKSLGFIAQEVETVFPNLVNDFSDENGVTCKGLTYDDFAVLAVQSIIDLNSKLEETVQAQNVTINDLKRELSDLKFKLEEITKMIQK